MDNPYQAPHAELLINDSGNALKDVFQRFSTWYVFILSILTLGLYVIYWMYSRTRSLNRLQGIEPISEVFILVAVAWNIVSYPLAFAEEFWQFSAELLLASTVFNIAASVLLLVWAFMFRSRLNLFLADSPLPSSRLGGVMTFFFQSLYLSYKINENLELTELPAAGADTATAEAD